MSKAEKYIEENTKLYSNISADGTMTSWLTPDQARRAVEIAREEVIENACEYLDGLIELLNEHGHGLKKERIIGGLKQAMKDE